MKRRIKTDIIIYLVNPDMSSKEMNIWDSIDKELRKRLPDTITVGSIKITCTNSYLFCYDNEMELGDKIYKLQHYLYKEQSLFALIYDFEKGWLAPLKVPVNLNKPMILTIPASSSVQISISTIW